MTVSDQTLVQLDSLLERRSETSERASGNWPDQVGHIAARSHKKRVLFLINSLEGGGAERVFTTVVNQVQSHLSNAEIDVVLLDDRPRRYGISAPVHFTCLGSNGGFWDSAKRYRQYLERRRPDVVISFLTRANYLAAAFAKAYGYRAIISERSDTNGRLGNGLAGWAKKMLVRALYPRAHKIIAVSEGIKRSLTADYGMASQSVEVIYNPYDLPHLHRLAQETSAIAEPGYILAVGRLVDTKRFDILIRAYAQGGFKQQLVILGEGPKLAELQALAKSLGVSQRVLFPGFLPNPYAVMARASVYVLCSELEGFPNALVEAMGIGRPVIATNCHHGPAEILDETVMPKVTSVQVAKYGILVPTADPDAMASALQQVLSDQTLRESLAERSAQRAGHFTVPATVTRYSRVVNEQLALVR